MTQATGLSKLAGHAGSLLLVIGLAAFFFGIFGPIRSTLFVGIGMIILALVAFAVEEFGPRR